MATPLIEVHSRSSSPVASLPVRAPVAPSRSGADARVCLPGTFVLPDEPAAGADAPNMADARKPSQVNGPLDNPQMGAIGKFFLERVASER